MPSAQTLASASPSPQPAIAVASADGVWLPQSDEIDHSSNLGRIWNSKLIFSHGKFELKNFLGTAQSMKGTFRVNTTTRPAQIDLDIGSVDLSETGQPIIWPACHAPAIYELEGDHLIVAGKFFASHAKRPTSFSTDGFEVLRFTRAQPTFRDFPKTVAITVQDPAGRPAPAASVFTFMHYWGNSSTRPSWYYAGEHKTDPRGVLQVPYRKIYGLLAARDPATNALGVVALSPASLQDGRATIHLQSPCILSGTVQCAALAQLHRPIRGGCIELYKEGREFLIFYNFAGDSFEFAVPPGKYMFAGSSDDADGEKTPLVVPADTRFLHLPPIQLTIDPEVLLEGKPAPPLRGIVGWRGHPVTLAQLRGKYVLLEFWGYWCGPCIQSMPVVIDLYDRFHNKGLAIVGIHVDMNGEVDTAAKLDQKIAGYRKDDWGGKDLPFPVALTRGTPIKDDYLGITSADYAISAYPSTILIDPQGNFVGHFGARDPVKSIQAMQKLLDRAATRP